MRRLLVFLPLVLAAARPDNDPPFGEFRWRQVGPCNMGGRITDIAVVESRPHHFYVAAATGGVWKTTNNGTTWTPVFDRGGTASIGDIAVAPSNPDVIWVGTGEANARNSVTHGDGVYKSVDGGKTFAHAGLRETRFIGRVAVHPTNPDIVYVAALGSIYVPSRDRGLYRTADGGKTWECVLFLNEDTGCIDVAIDPEKPDVVYAAAYEVRRDAFSGSGSPSRFGPAAGLYRSEDGGKTWGKLARGLPAVGTGRIGIDVWRKDPRVVVAIVEAAHSSEGEGGAAYMGIRGEDQEQGIALTRVSGPAEKSGLQVGDVIVEFDGKKVASYEQLLAGIRAHKAGDKVKVKVLRGGEEKTVEVTLERRPSGREAAPQGGVFRSEDRGETWTQMSTLNPRPFYFSQIRVDPADDKRVFVLGIELHLSQDGGRKWNNNAARGVHSDFHAMWIDPRDPDHVITGTDGGVYVSYDGSRTWEHVANLPIGQFYAIGLDMRKPYRIYGGLQDNGSWGGPSRVREPSIGNEHWEFLHGGDGFTCRVDPSDPWTVYCESQYGMPVRVDLRTGSKAGIRPKGSALRFEWNTPIELAPSDPKRLYIGAQKLFESSDRGAGWKEVSGDLTKTNSGAITTIGLSPSDENVIWVGTNDGAVRVTRDRGKTWREAKIPGMPELLWVTRVECGPDARTAFVTAEGRRRGDLRPYVWKTADFGETWTALTAGLPEDEPVYVVRQDRRNPALVFLGTERTVYASLGGGRRWMKFGEGLPVVPVHDLAIHPRDGELVAGTHGRSLWIADVRPLQELSVGVLLSKAHLFEPREETLWNPGRGKWFGGGKGFRGENPPSGATLWYYIGREPKEASLVVSTKGGEKIVSPAFAVSPGLHSIRWDLSRGRSRVPPGEYRVTLTVDGEAQTRLLRVLADEGEAVEGKNP
ncbi:MAG: PDZ domain-containing protein [Planctomycetes bacterium]|nr:PDZ domain-containing protein [Planctomycetota bacterium]